MKKTLAMWRSCIHVRELKLRNDHRYVASCPYPGCAEERQSPGTIDTEQNSLAVINQVLAHLSTDHGVTS